MTVASGEGWTLIHGDCPAALAELADNSVDSVVTDPPYGLSDHDAGDIAEALACWLRGDVYTHDKRGFMGKAWDGFVPGPDVWREVYRVLKPGGHLVCFSGSRTHDLMGIAIRLAGFELRDTINHASTPHYLGWVQGQGFPKSLSVGKAIDKAAGAEREAIGKRHPKYKVKNGTTFGGNEPRAAHWNDVTAPATPDAQRWEGWGTALKPSLEPILLFRKPLAASTVAANVLEHGTGAINISACRVALTGEEDLSAVQRQQHDNEWGHIAKSFMGKEIPMYKPAGRWPSNLCLSHSEGCVKVGRKRVRAGVWGATQNATPGNGGTMGDGWAHRPSRDAGVADADGMEEVDEWRCAPGCAVAALDSQAGERKSGNIKKNYAQPMRFDVSGNAHGGNLDASNVYGDTDSASRFFPVFAYEQDDFVPWLYCAKASRREREAGLEDLRVAPSTVNLRQAGVLPPAASELLVRNTHPCVKPLTLMSWLCRLVTPPGGVVLDPFTGSGSTGCAALREGFGFIGVEREAEYIEIARRRLEYTLSQRPAVTQARLAV